MMQHDHNDDSENRGASVPAQNMHSDQPQNRDYQPQSAQQAPGFSGDSQFYVQQLIDTLQKRNRFMNMMVIILVLVAVAAAFGAFKVYMDYQNAQQQLTVLEGEQKTTITSLQSNGEQLQAQYDELVTAKGELENQLEAASTKLQLNEQMVVTLKTNLDVVQAQATKMAQENEIIRSALDTSTVGKERTLSLIDEKEKHNQALQNEVTNRKRAFDALSKRYQSIRGDIASVKQRLDKSTAQLEQKNRDVKRLQGALRTSESAQTALKADNQALQTSLLSMQMKAEKASEAAKIEAKKPNVLKQLQPITKGRAPLKPAPIKPAPLKPAPQKPMITEPVVFPPANVQPSKATGSDGKKKPPPPLTPDQLKTFEVPDQIIIDLN